MLRKPLFGPPRLRICASRRYWSRQREVRSLTLLLRWDVSILFPSPPLRRGGRRSGRGSVLSPIRRSKAILTVKIVLCGVLGIFEAGSPPRRARRGGRQLGSSPPDRNRKKKHKCDGKDASRMQMSEQPASSSRGAAEQPEASACL